MHKSLQMKLVQKLVQQWRRQHHVLMSLWLLPWQPLPFCVENGSNLGLWLTVSLFCHHHLVLNTMFFTLSWSCKRGKKWLKFSHSEWNLGTSYILRCQFSCLSGGRVFVSCRTVQKLFSPSSQFKKKFVLVSGRFRMVFFFFFFFSPSSFENILWWLWLKYTLHCRVADKWRSVCENKII